MPSTQRPEGTRPDPELSDGSPRLNSSDIRVVVVRYGMAQIATLYMLCGLPGAGKTTLARRLERERGAFRLAEDDWMIRLFRSADGHGDEQRERIKTVQWEIAERILRLGGNVVLDWAFWLRSERDDYRARATALGASAELYYLDVPREELLRRLTERDLARPADSFPVTADELDLWTTMFEPPTVDEFEHR